jgi:uncharacterized protein YyaL (SSP411 family)
VFALELQRLALLTGDSTYDEVALRAMQLVRGVAPRSPLGFGTMLGAYEFYAGDSVEIVIVGDDSRELVDAVHTNYVPSKVLIASERPTADDARRIPLLEGRTDIHQATAFVCRRGICNLPVEDAQSMLKQIDSS